MKKKICIFICFMFLITFVGCSTNVIEAQGKNVQAVKFEKVETNQTNHLYILVDEETGINYFVYSNGYACGMTARYNADGSLYITEE